ncbi:MAG TPA: pitrilysin family protein [Bryobacteraceae bacterium]|nr:pitrilysin family protein [Bryobacteraceae bacterium]
MHIRWLFALAPLCLLAQDLKEFEKKVTEFTLANGLHMIVLRRPEAPVVSLVTYANVGSANDQSNKTGLAHMLEHMAFKGTEILGTKNWPEEKKLLAEIEAIYDKLEAEKTKGPRGSKDLIGKLQADLKATIEKANSYVDKEAYSRVIQENGGVGMNAGTSVESTVYFYSLPANRVELWFLLNSQVFRQPIMREFYKERDVVREERRMRLESSPQGKMQDALLTTSFLAHPQRQIIGWASDIENLRAKDAEELFRKYYVPQNMVMVLAGDVDPQEVKRLADQYYSTLPSGPPPPRVITEEPKQEGERRIAVETPSQPILMMSYKRPDGMHPDDAPLTVLASALASGRTGVLYKEMVEQKKISLAAFASANFIGNKFPGLFLFFAVPGMGKTLDENEKAMVEIIERMKKEKIDEVVLQRVKTKVRAGLIRSLDSNMGLAQQLAGNYILYGDWRKMFTSIQEIEKVTADDVQRVAKTYLVESGRTTVSTKAPPKGDAK